MIEWLNKNWLSLTVPTIVFLAFIVIAIWVRRTVYNYLDRLFVKVKWEGSGMLLQTTKAPFFQWCLLIGAYAAILVSTLSPQSKVLAGRILGSIFIISLT
jgi:small-conductance mechanosensitive channel